MEVLKPLENVSPDLTTYETMVATWRGSLPIPTLKEVQDKWTEIELADQSRELERNVQEKVLKLGVTQPVMIEALFRAVKYNDTSNLDQIASIIEAAQTASQAEVSIKP